MHLCSAECPMGYTGPQCTYPCTYPYYGEDCLSKCDCTEEQCDFAFGCTANSTPSKYIYIYFRHNKMTEILSPLSETLQKNTILSLIVQFNCHCMLYFALFNSDTLPKFKF